MAECLPEGFAARIEATNRQFFPENYADLRSENNPTGYESMPAWKIYAEMMSLCVKFYKDKSNSLADRISALDLHRKLLRDTAELAIFEELDSNEV